MDKGIVVYINGSYNGVAIFSLEESSDDCLYFTTWFDAQDFEKLEDIADMEDRIVAEKMIKDFCSGCESWDGNNLNPGEGGVQNFDQFLDLSDYDNWLCVYDGGND